LEAKPNDAGISPNGHHRHETKDAPMSGIFLLGGLFVVLLVVGLLVSLVAFRYFSRHQPLGPPASPFENARAVPPAPQLQVTPAADWHDYQKSQAEIVNSYGWVDEKAGIVRIPIDRAMDLVLQRGLPTRSAPSPGLEGPARGAGQRSRGAAAEGGPEAKPSGAQNQERP
jgi:hypothetical protein